MKNLKPKLDFLIEYDVHCTLKNFFRLKIKVKNVWNELQAKVELNAYLQKKYGSEYEYVTIKSCKCTNNFEKMAENLLGAQKPGSFAETFSDLLKTGKIK